MLHLPRLCRAAAGWGRFHGWGAARVLATLCASLWGLLRRLQIIRAA
ncbi:hypothetical protein [Thioalkalivibrio sulfidiphilus]